MGERIGNIETPEGDGNPIETTGQLGEIIIGNIETPEGDGNVVVVLPSLVQGSLEI